MESAVRLVAAPEADSEDTSPAPAATGSSSAPPSAGRFGNYELLGRIASGGMGVVYRARQLGLNRIVGRHSDVSPRSDVYSLGAILYQLVTGRPPFTADSATAVLRQVVQNDPPPPRVLNPAIARDLETICLKCLEKEPARRYATAQEVADELGRFQRLEPILARPLSPAARAWRWCRRRPAIAALLATVFVVFGAGFAATFAQWRRAEHAAEKLSENVTRLEIDRSEDWLERGDTSEALALLANVVRRDPRNRVAATRILAVLSQRRFILPANAVIQDDFVGRHSAFAQHGHWLVTATNRGATLQLWDTREGLRLERLMPCGEPVRVTSFRADGRQLAAATANGSVLVFDIAARSSRREEAPSEIRNGESLLASPAANAFGRPHRIGGLVAQRDNRRPPRGTTGHRARYSASTIYRQWKSIVDEHFWRRGADLERARARGAASDRRLVHRAEVNAVAVSPDASMIAAGTKGATAVLWDTTTGESIASLAHESQVLQVAFDPLGRRVVTASADATARVWELPSGRLLGEPLRHRHTVFGASFSPDGRWLVTCSEDMTARLWNADTLQPNGAPMRHKGDVRSVAFRPDGKILATAGTDSTVRLWSVPDGTPLGEPLRHSNWVSRVVFSPNGQVLASCGSEKGARLWNVFGVPASAGPDPLKAELRTSLFLRHEGHVSSVQFDPAGLRVVTASDDGTARIWSVSTGTALARPLRHDDRVVWAGFSPDGQQHPHRLERWHRAHLGCGDGESSD